MPQHLDQTHLELKSYFESVSAFSRSRHRPGWQYSSIEQFVLENGKFMSPSPLPSGFRRMQMGMCYKNAFELAVEDPSLVYVEGYACGIFPTLHAWLVRDGLVIDPTWDSSVARAYCGVGFSTAFVLDKICTSRYFGVLDDNEREWPLLRGLPKEVWSREVFEVRQAQQSEQGLHLSVGSEDRGADPTQPPVS